MAETPLISVITPVFNAERFLDDCLESVIRQSYANFELIIVNDGSTDSSASIINKYASRDNRIKVFNTNNQGVSAARNIALDNANGQYVTFLDSDDYLTVDFLEILYILSVRTGADIAVAGFTHNPGKLGLSSESFHTVDATGFTADVLFQKVSDTAICGKLFKKSLWNGERFLEMRYEDLEIIPRIYLKATKIAHTEARLYFYRIHDCNFFNTWTAERTDAMKAIKIVEQNISDNHSDNRDLKMAATSRRLAVSFNMFVLTYKRPGYEHIARQSWSTIKSLRLQCLKHPRVIKKIKIGILASFAGPHSLYLLNRMVGISR